MHRYGNNRTGYLNSFVLKTVPTKFVVAVIVFVFHHFLNSNDRDDGCCAHDRYKKCCNSAETRH